MAKHKLILDDIFEAIDYALIAIHCSLEDYRLAYVLNRNLNINLLRKTKDIDYAFATYSIYEWEDKNHLTTWNLVNNICRKESEAHVVASTLFGDDTKAMRSYNLISEYKSVDFFLKINNGGGPLKEKRIIEAIQSIPQIITAYTIDATALKSKNNLIFN